MQIGPYQTLQLVEEDGLSIVYLARHEPMGQPAMLTYIKPGSARSIEDWVAWLRIVKGLNHLNIVVYSEGGRTADGGLYVAGPHLSTALQPNTPLTPNQVLTLSSQLSVALDFAHSKNIFHGPIRSWQVVLLPTAQYAIRDFERGGDLWSHQRAVDIAALAQVIRWALTGQNTDEGVALTRPLPGPVDNLLSLTYSAPAPGPFNSAGAFHSALTSVMAALPEAQRNRPLSGLIEQKVVGEQGKGHKRPFWQTMGIVVLVGLVVLVGIANLRIGTTSLLDRASHLVAPAMKVSASDTPSTTEHDTLPLSSSPSPGATNASSEAKDTAVPLTATPISRPLLPSPTPTILTF